MMTKHKCVKCNKDATVIEDGKYFCSKHGKEYVFRYFKKEKRLQNV